jgi:hypothetical protein
VFQYEGRDDEHKRKSEYEVNNIRDRIFLHAVLEGVVDVTPVFRFRSASFSGQAGFRVPGFHHASFLRVQFFCRDSAPALSKTFMILDYWDAQVRVPYNCLKK